jgi:hypothetical protein
MLNDTVHDNDDVGFDWRNATTFKTLSLQRTIIATFSTSTITTTTLLTWSGVLTKRGYILGHEQVFTGSAGLSAITGTSTSNGNEYSAR